MNSSSDHIPLKKDRLPTKKTILKRAGVIAIALVILFITYDLGLHAWFDYTGTRHLEAQEYDEAIGKFTMAANPLLNDEYWLYKRGLAYARKGNYDKAIEDYPSPSILTLIMLILTSGGDLYTLTKTSTTRR